MFSEGDRRGISYKFASSLGLDINNFDVNKEVYFDELLSDALEISNVNKYELLSHALSLNIYIELELRQSSQDLKEQIFQLEIPDKCEQEKNIFCKNGRTA